MFKEERKGVPLKMFSGEQMGPRCNAHGNVSRGADRICKIV